MIADVTLQAAAVLNREIASSGLRGRLAIIPDAFGRMDFTLLVSKKSAIGADFVTRFDAALAEMKADGSYDELVLALNRGGPN